MIEFGITDMVWRLLGVAGFALYVTNYLMLSWRWLDTESSAFFFLNTTAAALVLASNYVDFNLASALIQVFWIVIGFNAIFLRRKSLRAEAAAA